MVRGKKYQEKEKLVDKAKMYSSAEAFTLVKQTARTKFDETVELALKLGVDSKKHSIRGTVMLPGGSGKTKKVAVIAKSERVKEAEDAGADVFGSDDLVEKISKGFMDFNTLIVTPDMMGSVGKLGKILGPKGLMPNPKTGTVTFEIAKTVKDFKGGKVEFKMDKGSVLHMVLGKVSFAEAALQDNLNAALKAIMHMKPSGFKGIYLKSVNVSSTMGPGVKIDIKSVLSSAGIEG
ncbi:MAG: 50S ribosomal protein L1 [Candidatus Margulisbacteria bacterium]|nr:50S ribosomal protein L1 [Candidatus Margulisiibacteriota bacterium]